MKYLTDQFQFCFCFSIGNTKQLYFLCIGKTIHILTENWLVDTCFVSSLHSGI